MIRETARNRVRVPDRITIFRYFVVGGVAALGYLAVAIPLEHAVGLPPTLSSLIAYITMVPIAYIGHKRITFQSAGSHRQEFPRFFISTAIGIALSTLMPWWAVAQLGLNPLIGYILVCIVVPTTNYLMLTGFVFLLRSHEQTQKL